MSNQGVYHHLQRPAPDSRQGTQKSLVIVLNLQSPWIFQKQQSLTDKSPNDEVNLQAGAIIYLMGTGLSPQAIRTSLALGRPAEPEVRS
jgi:hypothetical protein